MYRISPSQSFRQAYARVCRNAVEWKGCSPYSFHSLSMKGFPPTMATDARLSSEVPMAPMPFCMVKGFTDTYSTGPATR